MKRHSHTLSRRAWLRSTLLLAILGLPGCQLARMPLPDGLAASERMAVSGRQGLLVRQRLQFGPYEVHQVSRSWTRGRDRGSTSSALHSERRQTYRFTLREDGTDHWHVACHASVNRFRIDAVVVDVHATDESALYCNLQSAEDATSAWELDLRERQERPLSGAMTLHTGRVEIIGTNRLEKSLPMGDTTGYEFRAEGHVVGAVEVINNGAVWLRPDVDPDRRRLLAAAAAVLLLLEDLRTSLQES
jgi:hypothetical protein